MKWYKRDPDAALIGMRELTDIEYRAYGVLLDLLYSRNGDVADDEKLLCTHIGWRPQRWRKARAGLLAKGKIHITADGRLGAKRVVNELETSRKLIENMRVLRQKQLQYQRNVLAGPPGQPQPYSKKERGWPTKRWEPSGYPNGRSLGNGKAGSITETKLLKREGGGQ